ncbi:cytochrome P450 [Usnea florida]
MAPAIRSGPVIRINPWEIHIADSEFYEVLYSTKSRYDKIAALKYRFGLPLSSFDTIGHDHHHLRRSAIGPYFARQKVNDFSPYIQSLALKLCDKLDQEYGGENRVVNLNEAYAAFVSDAITWYTFAFSYDFLGFPEFVTPFTTSIRKLAMSLHVEIMSQVLKIISGENSGYKSVSHKMVFNELLQSILPSEELSAERLKHEAASITGAGIETTKTALSLDTFHILDNVNILKRLREELFLTIPDLSAPMPIVPELEKLPYLTAIVQEGKGNPANLTGGANSDTTYCKLLRYDDIYWKLPLPIVESLKIALSRMAFSTS